MKLKNTSRRLSRWWDDTRWLFTGNTLNATRFRYRLKMWMVDLTFSLLLWVAFRLPQEWGIWKTLLVIVVGAVFTLFTLLLVYAFFLFDRFEEIAKQRQRKREMAEQDAESEKYQQRRAEERERHEQQLVADLTFLRAHNWLPPQKPLYAPLQGIVHFLEGSGTYTTMGWREFRTYVNVLEQSENKDRLPKALLFQDDRELVAGSGQWCTCQGLILGDLKDRRGHTLCVDPPQGALRGSPEHYQEMLRIMGEFESVREYAAAYRLRILGDAIGQTFKKTANNRLLEQLRLLAEDTSLTPFLMTHQPDLLQRAATQAAAV